MSNTAEEEAVQEDQPSVKFTPDQLLGALTEAFGNATDEQKKALMDEMGLAKAVGRPKRLRTEPRQTNQNAQEISRISGGASHGPDFIPAIPDWVVELGGGLKQKPQHHNSKKDPEFLAWNDGGLEGNWSAEICVDRWLKQLPPLPSIEHYLRERERSSAWNDSIEQQSEYQGLVDAENIAAGATM